MAYHFQGVFIERPVNDLKELEKLFGGYARAIEAPFVGVVVCFTAKSTVFSAQILRLSKQIPESRLVYIDYSTFGGPPEYVTGFGCQNGQMIEGSWQKRDDKNAGDALLHLLEFVGAKSPEFCFAPFERGFFPNT